MTTETLNCQKKKKKKKNQKTFSSEAVRGMKLELSKNVHNISLYKKYVFFLRLLLRFPGYGSLEFLKAYNDNSGLVLSSPEP